MRARLIVTTIVAAGLALAVGAIALAGKPAAPDTSKYPDLRTVVPTHLNLVNQQQNEYLRFSNGIANTGGGPWAMRPENELGSTPTTTALAGDSLERAQYRCRRRSRSRTTPATRSSTSNRCRSSSTTQRTTTGIRPTSHASRCEKGSPTGQVMNDNSIKVGFCLLDLYSLDGNAPTSAKTFWDCYTSYQGVSVGWVDQYHQATDGQQVDLTDLPNGTDYYLVSTTNPTGAFLEQSKTNNTAWVRFTLSADSNGNRKVTVTGNSPCEPGTGLCGERSTNR